MGMYFYVVITIAVLFADGFYVRYYTASVFFLCAMVGVSIFRVIHFYAFDRFDRLSPKVNQGVFFVSVYATAFIWGAGFAYVLVQPGEEMTKMLMLTSTAGLNAGGVVSFIPARIVALFYNLLMLLPGIVMMGLLRINIVLIFLFILFAAYMTIIAFRGNREYWDALENEHQLRIKTEEIEKMSRIDSLTRLYNRNYFDEMFNIKYKTAARNSMYLTIIICDIDNFKPINDTYGHLAGDAYLEKIAGILSDVFKRDTDFLARYGGEEFVVLLLNQKADQATQLSEQVRTKVEKLIFPYSKYRIQTTMSFGIASCVPSLDQDHHHLLEKADKALYRAKNSGRNRVVL